MSGQPYTAAELLAMTFSGHEPLLDLARSWRLERAPPRRGEQPPPRTLVEALTLLRGLHHRHPLVPDILQELLLVLLDLNELGDVEVAVYGVDPASPMYQNEEFICRTARLFKEKADRILTDDPTAVAEADRWYAVSEQRYEAAYRLDQRLRHDPGVNVAGLRLVRAGLARRAGRTADATGLMQQADRRAEDLLAGRAEWSDTQPRDPEVWHPAAAADCHLIRKAFTGAARLYGSIPAEPWEVQSVGRPVKRVVDALTTLGIDVPPPFVGFDPTNPTHLRALFPAARH